MNDVNGSKHSADNATVRYINLMQACGQASARNSNLQCTTEKDNAITNGVHTIRNCKWSCIWRVQHNFK